MRYSIVPNNGLYSAFCVNAVSVDHAMKKAHSFLWSINIFEDDIMFTCYTPHSEKYDPSYPLIKIRG